MASGVASAVGNPNCRWRQRGLGCPDWPDRPALGPRKGFGLFSRIFWVGNLHRFARLAFCCSQRNTFICEFPRTQETSMKQNKIPIRFIVAMSLLISAAGFLHAHKHGEVVP